MAVFMLQALGFGLGRCPNDAEANLPFGSPDVVEMASRLCNARLHVAQTSRPRKQVPKCLARPCIEAQYGSATGCTEQPMRALTVSARF